MIVTGMLGVCIKDGNQSNSTLLFYQEKGIMVATKQGGRH